MNVVNPAELRALVRPDRVHRSLYTDPAIFALEMKNIFGRAWVYVGHDSLVPKPGDYLASRIGSQAVLLSRHTDGKVYVLYNRCSHRGAALCNEERVAWGAAQYGHSYAGHQPVAEGRLDDSVFDEYVAALAARHSKARTEEILTPRGCIS